MRSIRLSLVVYFLVLLTVALGAVCWFVYQLAAAALDERYQASQRLVRSQHKTHSEEVLTGFDRRVLRQAHYVAAMARTPVHVEATYPAGLVGLAVTPQPHLHAWLWVSEGIAPVWRPRPPGEGGPSLADLIFRARAAEINIEAADDLIPADQKRDERSIDSTDEVVPVAPPDHAHEYFQAFYREKGRVSRSQSLILANAELPIDGSVLKMLIDRQPHERYEYDTMRGPGGRTLRRVTLVSSMRRQPRAVRDASREWDCWAYLRGMPPLGKGFGKGPPAPPPGFMARPEVPFFVQYAIDSAPTMARLKQFEDERDQQLAQLEADTQNQLQALQRKLLWIALAAFGATFAGGYGLLRIGLTPIGRLSDAVSKVTERDFRLRVDPARLPTELQPIAHRLSHTLEQLGRAFEREKQAAADISHELRTPLAALMTTIEVALRKSRSLQEYREILEDCHTSGEQMSHLVERLLALARLDAGAVQPRPQAIDAAELAIQCADLIQPLARAQGLALTTRIAPPLPVETDPDKLREVVTNLLHNAVQYNRPGGTIELTVERLAGALSIEVRDTGIGISAEAKTRIFERFYRADPSRHSDTPHAGLGLAIVKSYIDLLGGTITVDSTPGEGTAFRVRLPVRDARAAAAEPKLVVA
jgi:heavy metal sensor kinase